MARPDARLWLPALALLFLALTPLADALAADVVDPGTDEGISWGPLIGACLGVAFGGALALWQIRGMKSRD